MAFLTSFSLNPAPKPTIRDLSNVIKLSGECVSVFIRSLFPTSRHTLAICPFDIE